MEDKQQKGTYYPAKCPRCKNVMASYMGGEIYTCSNCNEDNGVELFNVSKGYETIEEDKSK